MKFFAKICLAALALCCQQTYAENDIHGKADIGYVYTDFKTVHDHATLEKRVAQGIRANAAIVLPSGLCFKPSVLIVDGNCSVQNGALSVGLYIPYKQKWSFQPYVGGAIGRYTTLSHIFGNRKQVTKSSGPHVGVDISVQPHSKWLLSFSVQHAWAHSKTDFEGSHKMKSHAGGFNYGAAIDYYIKPKLSLNAAVGYNLSLDKADMGLQVRGVRVGIGQTF